MAFKYKNLKLNTRMILVLGLVSAIQTGCIGLFAWTYLSNSLDEQIGLRALNVAKTIAAMPEVIDSVTVKNSMKLQSLALKLADTNNALFIVIGDRTGIRLAHPITDKIGKSMADDDGDDNAPALVRGEGYISKALGWLGYSMRGKAPIFDNMGENIIGVVSVGYQLDQVQSTIDRYGRGLFITIIGMLFLSVIMAIIIAKQFKKEIFGLEPEQIARSFEERNATLQSVREGIIAINRQGIITTFNKNAIETLDLNFHGELAGKHITDVLPESGMPEILINGEPQFDREVWLNGRSIIVNRLPVKQGEATIGVVSSFRLKNELDLVSKKLTQIQQYADSLRSQAHEYSNKLHTIAGLIQIGSSDEALAFITSETQSNQELIQLLLNAVPDPVIAGCLMGKFNRARELGLTMKIDPESHMHDLPDNFPREQLVSALGNLIDNALEATRSQHGSHGSIFIGMTDLGNDLIFEVEDEGPGITESTQQRIFEKGYSSKAGIEHGIGLYLVKLFVDRMGGTITVENTLDQATTKTGSRFTLYLPKKQNPDNQCKL
jgi:two-component system CitB family sensor kinase